MRYTLAGLHCADCAARIEQELRKLKGLEGVAINLADPALDLSPELVPAAREAVARIEPGVRLVARTGGGSAG
ncbi:MAG: heavy metal-associated domain-containing protein, partial [Bacillota bacterium]